MTTQTNGEIPDEDDDPVGDAYAKGYADGYKAKALAIEEATKPLVEALQSLKSKTNAAMGETLSLCRVSTKVSIILDDFWKDSENIIDEALGVHRKTAQGDKP